jgi:hypothetical protein
MATKSDFQPVFDKLKPILQQFESKLIVVHDTNDHYYLDTPVILKNKRRCSFGAVEIGKNYVSFHLMPIYACPDLLKELSPELRKRMQGKACFNFSSVDEKLFKELDKITKKGFVQFKPERFA